MHEVRRINFKKIEELRLNMGLGKMAFCKKAGVGMDTYKRLPTAERLHDAVLFRIADGLGVKPTELIYWEEVD